MLVLRSDSQSAPAAGKIMSAAWQTRVEQRRMEAPEIWLPTADGSLLVPAQVLRAVVSWSSEIHS